MELCVCFHLQAMASLGPHRVKVDGKSFSPSSGYCQYQAECSHRPTAPQEELIQYFLPKVLKFIDKETNVAFGLLLNILYRISFNLPFPLVTFFFFCLLTSFSPQFCSFSFSPSSPCSKTWPTPPCGALWGRSTFLWQPVVLQGTGHLHQQEGRLPDKVCVCVCVLLRE